MVVIRLAPSGRKHSPVYKIMVAEKDAKLTGRFIEKLGIYKPGKEKDEFHIDTERYTHWVKKGATPSPRIESLIREQLALGAAANTSAVAKKEAKAKA
jgi:small subunit ribosomal protein S16